MQKTLYSKENQILRQLLTQTRDDAGLTQVELGAMLDEDQTWVSKVERGIRRLDLIELTRWSEAVGLTLSTFVQRYEKMLGRSL